jgi:hypothetical protein
MSLGRYKAPSRWPPHPSVREPQPRRRRVYGFGVGLRLPPISPIIGLGLMGCGNGGFGGSVAFGLAMTTG